MHNKASHELLQKYLAGNCTEQEKAIVEKWYLDINAGETEINYDRIEEFKKQDYQLLLNATKKGKTINWPLRIATIAAAIIIILSIGTLVFGPIKKPLQTYTKDIKPGRNKATLTLPNGKVIDLDEVKNGELAVEQNVKIIKKADGQLIYEFSPGADKTVNVNSSSGLNSIVTPRGGQYQVILPDGTKVWLNACSKLKFPSTFKGMDYREVVLVGEAYFEVSTVKSRLGLKKEVRKMPFKVKTSTQEITVLGTHFNVNSYPDESSTKTTLLEGSVSIAIPLLKGKVTMLKPGEQSINDGTNLKVKKVNVDDVVAWKKGYFNFSENENIKIIMPEIARWYDIEISYIGDMAGVNFTGSISRSKNISAILKLMESTKQVSFKIQGRKIIAIANK